MKGVEEQQSVVLDEGEKEKRRRRRGNRRSKQILPPVTGSSIGSSVGNFSPMYVSEKQIGVKLAEASPSKSDIPLDRASDVEFSSLPNMTIAFSRESAIGCPPPPISDGISLPINSRSCSEPIYVHGTRSDTSSYKESDVLHGQCFATHWSLEAANEAVENGDAFRAEFRVNAYNRLEGYCTLDGIPTDILISGFAAQNRAVEGDVVAVKLDPVTTWPKVKGFGRCSGNGIGADDNRIREVAEIVDKNCKEKEKAEYKSECCLRTNDLQKLPGEGLCLDIMNDMNINNNTLSGDHATASYSSVVRSSSLKKLFSLISSSPLKRPTGRVLAVLQKSPRRDSLVGFLSTKQFYSCQDGSKCDIAELSLHTMNPGFPFRDFIQMNPTDPRFPTMIIPVRFLPESIKERLMRKDDTVRMELVGAKIVEWRENCLLPLGQMLHVFGQSGEIEPQIAAIIFENRIYDTKFSPESLACLPSIPWEIPKKEFLKRKDFRGVCTFTIDPPSATELDDALSVEMLSEDVCRVGIHLADVSYFVQPETALDVEARLRSTSVYLLQHKLSMLPPDLSEGIGSLIPGVDRLTLSIMWDIDQGGELLDQWIDHSVIHSCCKLSYTQAQMIIDGLLEYDTVDSLPYERPNLYGTFEWSDICRSVKVLHMISKKLRESRFKSGALWLENSKPVFMFDEIGVPYESKLCELTDANFLVEEFMLLANQAAAKVISRAFPDCALLRRHPNPSIRKLKEFEAFCSKHGFEMDISSSGNLHFSLSNLKEKLKSDAVLFDVLINYATKSMQLARYFCSGDLKEREHDWTHYALAVPCYTHFTSPLRRYPDIIVHRTLSAIIDARKSYFHCKGCTECGGSVHSKVMNKCFMSLNFDGESAKSVEGEKALSAAALKHKFPRSEVLTSIAEYCNERKLASRFAEEASQKLYLWVLLKQKETIVADGRVLGLGPKFMTVYIHKFKMEQRINYGDVEGLFVDWLETTNKLVLDISQKRFQKKGILGKFRPLEDIALVVNPSSLDRNQCLPSVGDAHKTPEVGLSSNVNNLSIESVLPSAFPLTLEIFSHVSVALHAYGGEGNPIEIKAKLYMCSYFSRESI